MTVELWINIYQNSLGDIYHFSYDDKSMAVIRAEHIASNHEHLTLLAIAVPFIWRSEE
jgi:hypothetical protein